MKESLNVALWQNKSEKKIVQDLASIAFEQREGSLAQRVNHLMISLDDFALLQNGLSWKTEIERTENAAYFKILRWLESDGTGYMLWVSPPSREYPEPRFVVYEPSFLAKENILSLDCWAICGKETKKECLDIASKIGNRPFDDSEELRSNPLSFKPQGLSWTTYLSEFFGEADVWQAIENGEVEKKKGELLIIAKQIVMAKQGEIQKNNTWWERIKVGAEIELLLEKKMGFRLQRVGSCGLSNLAMVEGQRAGVLSDLTQIVEFKTSNFVKECPYCHRQINRKMETGEKCLCGRRYPGPRS